MVKTSSKERLGVWLAEPGAAAVLLVEVVLLLLAADGTSQAVSLVSVFLVHIHLRQHGVH